jgi:hypothetical protein
MSAFFYHGTHRVGSSRESRWVCFSWVESQTEGVRFQGRRYVAVNVQEFPTDALAVRERDKRRAGVVERGAAL